MKLPFKTLAALSVGLLVWRGSMAGGQEHPVTQLEPTSQVAPAPPLFTLLGSIPLPGVEGRLDHFAADPQTHRLFVSALENHSLEVLDIATRQRIHSITGIKEPQGILFVPATRQILVCSRGDGTIRSFDGTTFAEGPWADLGHNADNARLDARTHTVYVGSGGEPGSGLLSAIDVASLLPVKQGGKAAAPRSPADLLLDRPRQADVGAEVALESHPESFQIDAAHQRIFVNVPDDHYIAVVKAVGGKLNIVARWPVTVAQKNFPMTLDAAGSRLFVACRKPALLLAYNANTGKLTAQLPCVGDADDMYYDAVAQRLYVIGGAGAVDVFTTAGQLRRLASIPTAPKARTGLFIPSLRLLAVAVPHTPGHAAAILLFRVRI